MPLIVLLALAVSGCGALPQELTNTCGDGIVQAGEGCDGNASTCAANEVCLATTCQCVSADSVIGGQPSPQPAVDPPPAAGETLPEGVCGDGVLNAGEQCDGLRARAIDPICPEICDANGCREDCSVGVIGCDANEFFCSINCTCEPRPDTCGDGIVTGGFEECEPQFCREDASGQTICSDNWGCSGGEVCDANSCLCGSSSATQAQTTPGATPGTATTPQPTAQVAASCGNSTCNTGETCVTCPIDCGACQPSGGAAATATTQVTSGGCAGAASVETFPIYDCFWNGNGWTYYEGMRCFDSSGNVLFDGRVSGPITAGAWQPFCPAEPT